MVKRSAFTMIELIFAIVVIAITVISLPMMVQANYKGLEGNVKQEAIFATSAKLMQVLSHAWDGATIDANLSASTINYARVMDTWHNNNYVRKNLVGADDNTSRFRLGHIRQGLHRRFFDTAELAALTPGAGIEGQVGATIVVAAATNGYKYNMQLSVTENNISDVAATFAFDSNATVSSNMKLVTVTTIIDINGNGSYTDAVDESVVLRGYAANIGEVDYNKRTYF